MDTCGLCGRVESSLHPTTVTGAQGETEELGICSECKALLDERKPAEPIILQAWTALEMADGVVIEWAAHTSWFSGYGDCVAVAIRVQGKARGPAMMYSAGTKPTEHHARNAYEVLKDHL